MEQEYLPILTTSGGLIVRPMNGRLEHGYVQQAFEFSDGTQVLIDEPDGRMPLSLRVMDIDGAVIAEPRSNETYEEFADNFFLMILHASQSPEVPSALGAEAVLTAMKYL